MRRVGGHDGGQDRNGLGPLAVNAVEKRPGLIGVHRPQAFVRRTHAVKSADIDWRTGRVEFWDLETLDEEQPLADQVQELKEDLAQVEYPSRVLLDIGWYSEFSEYPERGAFKIYVVRKENWDQPLFQTTCATIAALKKALLEAVIFAANAATHAPE